MTRFVTTALSIALVAASVGVAQAQDYPVKPVRIVTTGAGGSGDIISRLVAQEIAPALGQPVIVDNRTTLGAIDFAAKAPPDGYTILESGGAIWTTPLLQDATWDAIR